MGLLDDAIREHLDLKRRRGGDPAEIERAEREALGPVRRGPEAQEQQELEQESEQGLPYDDEQNGTYEDEEPDWGEAFDDAADSHGDARFEEEPFASEPESGPDPGLAEPSRLDAPAAGAQPPPVAPPPRFEEEPTRHMPIEPADQLEGPGASGPPAPHPASPADATVEPTERPPRRGRSDPVSGETVEYEVEADFEKERGPAEEDVLEETPEFLQDTPDHDRLWFEQRPPRDFDFDG